MKRVIRIAVVTIGLLSPLAALVAMPGSSSASKNWNAPIRLVAASGHSATPYSKNWN